MSYKDANFISFNENNFTTMVTDEMWKQYCKLSEKIVWISLRTILEIKRF